MNSPKHVPFYFSPLPENGVWSAPLEICVEDLKNKTVSTESEFLKEVFNHDLISHEYIDPKSFYGFSDFAGDNVNDRIRKECLAKLGKEPKISFDAIGDDYVIYAMVSAAFKYSNPFEDMECAEFENSDGSKTANIRFFGFEGREPKDVEYEGIVYKNAFPVAPDCAEHVRVLYYNDPQHHAVKISTYRGSSIILVRNPEGNSAEEVFENAQARSVGYDTYETPSSMTGRDWMSVPELELDIEDDFDEFKGQKVIIEGFAEGHEIKSAKQITSFKLDREGVSFESEAGMDFCSLGLPPRPDASRFFLYDGPFAMFLIDEHSAENRKHYLDKPLSQKPYACIRVDDIRYFQKPLDNTSLE